ncbi:MAG TPA: ABC transporter permease [Gemmatimonadaceae bacterium]|nr:ABC transporter permease [Gemmatimonadaceae bacterium]
MMPFERIRLRLRAALRRRAADRELDEEIRFHLEREQEKNVSAGMSDTDAWRRAYVAFGGVQQVREAHREVRGVPWLADLTSDMRVALRALVRRPALAGAAVITLALGIGANTAIFSAVDAAILRPLPFPDAGRLVMLGENNPEFNWHMESVAGANYLDWKEQVGAFQDIAAYTSGTGHGTLTGAGDPQLLTLQAVTGNFFTVLGGRAELGRGFVDDETWDTTHATIVLSDHAWRTRFGADPGVVGRTIHVDGRPTQVIGVMAAGFTFPSSTVDAWYTQRWDRASRTKVWFRRAHWLRAIARLKPGVSVDEANAQFQVVVRRLQQQYPVTNRVMGAGMVPLHTYLVGDTRTALLVLLAASGLLLLIACANVGNLMLVHANGRAPEVALRLALGAGPWRLTRQVLTESLVLSSLGGAAGFALAWLGTRAITLLAPALTLPDSGVHIDWSVLAYTLAITTACGVLFGIGPALWSARRAPGDALKEGGRGRHQGRRMRRWGEALAVAEIALALMLLSGAGLLVRSLWRLAHVAPGFDPRGVLAVGLELPQARYDTTPKVNAFDDALVARARGLRGVTDAAIVSHLPLTGTEWTSSFSIAGRRPGEYGSEVAHREVGPDYFRLMREPLYAGRTFNVSDRDRSPKVVLINDVLARRFFAGQNPIGQRLTFDKVPDSSSVWGTIVGVVGSEHQISLGAEPRIEIFTPQAEDPSGDIYLMVRTTGDPMALLPHLRSILHDIDPEQAIVETHTLDEIVATSMARARFLTTLLLVFAAVGLALAVVGVYGVMAQLAQRRTREMGIRLALGAPARAVRWLIVRHALGMVVPGLVIGTGAALLATQALRSVLYHVAPTDPLTFVAVPLALALSALVASWLPAAQASRADPAQALHVE